MRAASQSKPMAVPVSGDARLHVLQITHDLAIGGLQQVVVNLCHSLDRERFRVSVLCLRALGELVPEVEAAGVPVYLLPKKIRGTDYFSFLKIADLIRELKVQVVHTHNTQPFVEGAVAARMRGVSAIVHTDHGRSWPDKRRYMFAEWGVSHLVHRVVGVSEHTTECLRQYERIPRRKLMTIPNGVDGARYTRRIDRQAKRQELGIPPDGPVVGLGCRLVEGKGIQYLLQAMARLRESLPTLRLVIAGNGPYEADLRAQAEALGLTKVVRFLGPRTDMPEILGMLDLYVLPSLSEGMPMALLEAMAAGCPIVATDVGGVPAVLGGGEAGVLVPARDPGALAEAIALLVENEPLRHRYVLEAKRRFEAEFSARVMAEKYERLYRGLD